MDTKKDAFMAKSRHSIVVATDVWGDSCPNTKITAIEKITFKTDDEMDVSGIAKIAKQV